MPRKQREGHRCNFTKALIDKLPPPGNNKAYTTYYDSSVPKLAVLVHPSGRKTFYVITKHYARTERVKLGFYPELSIENARKKAMQVLGELTRGINPQDAKRTLRREPTFNEAFQWFTEKYAPNRKRPSSITEDKGLHKRYLTDWDSRKLSAITREMVTRKHNQIGSDHGKYAANRMLALVRSIFNKMIQADKWNGLNPAADVDKFPEESRDRVLQPDEIGKFISALMQDHDETARDCTLMLLLTGARKSNAIGMKWKQINFKSELWTIPTTKSGKAHTVPLLPQAILLLKNRKTESTSDYVFPGPGKNGHIHQLRGVLKRTIKRAELADLRLHDLRRTMGTWLIASGASTFITQKALAHETVEATSVYVRPPLDAIRRHMETAVSAMFEAAKSKEVVKPR